jgi:cytochrome c-type biogenesis protein CcmH
MTRLHRRLRHLLSLALAALLLANSNQPQAPYANLPLPNPAQEAQARALMAEIRCTVCQGQAIGDSNAEMAGDMRALIRTRIAAGEQPQAIRQWLIARYGGWISYDPPLDATSAGLWVVLAVSGLGLALFARRRLQRGAA